MHTNRLHVAGTAVVWASRRSICSAWSSSSSPWFIVLIISLFIVIAVYVDRKHSARISVTMNVRMAFISDGRSLTVYRDTRLVFFFAAHHQHRNCRVSIGRRRNWLRVRHEGWRSCRCTENARKCPAVIADVRTIVIRIKSVCELPAPCTGLVDKLTAYRKLLDRTCELNCWCQRSTRCTFVEHWMPEPTTMKIHY